MGDSLIEGAKLDDLSFDMANFNEIVAPLPSINGFLSKERFRLSVTNFWALKYFSLRCNSIIS